MTRTPHGGPYPARGLSLSPPNEAAPSRPAIPKGGSPDLTPNRFFERVSPGVLIPHALDAQRNARLASAPRPLRAAWSLPRSWIRARFWASAARINRHQLIVRRRHHLDGTCREAG